MDFIEICNVYVGKMIIKAAKTIFNSDKICRSYSDLNFGVTFLEHSVEYFCFYDRCQITVALCSAAQRAISPSTFSNIPTDATQLGPHGSIRYGRTANPEKERGVGL